MFYVVYGSQTGNSEAIAKRISMELKKDHNINNQYLVLNKFLSYMQKFPEKKNEKNFVIIVCSTTGNGDAPNNGDNFVRWIKRKTHSSDLLNNVYYTILGLGDSNYSKYQYIPRQIDEYLSKLGAGRFYSKGEADEAYGLERIVEPWVTNLYVSLNSFLQTLTINSNDNSSLVNGEEKSEKNENFTGKLKYSFNFLIKLIFFSFFI
jgi:sulfite reductase alpha subunit-like flavoprotein